MKSTGFASIAATVLSGALFATSVAAADLPPIVIKVWNHIPSSSLKLYFSQGNI
jgi:hypothetical protein